MANLHVHTVTGRYLCFVFHLCTRSLHPGLDVRPPAQFIRVHIYHTTPETNTHKYRERLYTRMLATKYVN